MKSTRVTVIGAGNMGSALARAFAGAGHKVTVWNRTIAKAAPMAEVCTVQPKLDEAIKDAEVAVVSLSDYRVFDAVVAKDEIGDLLAAQGPTLVQLSSGTPKDARSAEQWSDSKGVKYLDGAILAYPSFVATEYATVFYSGKKKHFDAIEETLQALAKSSVFVDEAIGAAATIDCAILEAYYGGCAAFLHAAAMCRAEGIDPNRYFAYKDSFVGLISVTADAAQPMVSARAYEGTQCTLNTHVAAIAHIVGLSRDAGIDVTFPKGLYDRYAAAIQAGYGEKELPAVFETFLEKEAAVPATA
jgi:3-hydroxyisobutyrate dehydrogenase-like beta-hydroxyacid dehydrogenase